MRSRESAAISMVLLMLLTPLSGCFGTEAGAPSSDDLEVRASSDAAGFFVDYTFEAGAAMSVFIPYLLIDPMTQFVQNSTVIDLEKGGSETISILTPPRIDSMLFMIC